MIYLIFKISKNNLKKFNNVIILTKQFKKFFKIILFCLINNNNYNSVKNLLNFFSIVLLYIIK